jgi:hypothetical protein
MTVADHHAGAAKPKGGLVSAPAIKLIIGFTASICAVLFPRLLAALTVSESATITFVSRQYLELALLMSALVGVVVMILEWRVPRAPRDTFLMTLGLPAILAGALSANQNTAALQDAAKAQDALAAALARQTDIPIEPAKPATDGGKPQGQSIDLFATPVYAQQTSAVTMPAAQAARPLAIMIDQPKYAIVLDRAPTQQAAQAKAAVLDDKLKRTAPAQPFNVQVYRQGNEFLVVAPGGARTKSDALIEALRLKNTYQVRPALVEVEKKE